MRLPLVVAAMFIALALAGCGVPKPKPPVASTGGPGAVGFSFTPAVTMPTSGGFAEPGIRVAPDGTIYVTAPGVSSGVVPGVGGPRVGDTIWRSDDGGKTFVKLPTPDAGFGGGDSDIAVASDGTLYHSGLWSGCVSLSVSSDKGMTWRTNPLGCGYTAGGDDRNWLATSGNQYVYLAFGWAPNPSSQGPQGRISLVRSVVGGQPAAVTTASFQDNYQWPGNLAVDPVSGAVYIAYNTVDDSIVLLKSTDAGLTLTKSVVATGRGDTFDSFAVVATAKDGSVYMVWSERVGYDGTPTGYTEIDFAWSPPGGSQWSTPVRVNAAKGTHIFPWIDAGDPGHVAIAWYGTDASGKSAEEVDGLWYVHLAESHDANGATPTWKERLVSDQPILKGSVCTSGTGCKPGTRDLLDYFQVSLDRKGDAHLIWATKGVGEKTDLTNPTTLAYAKQLIGTSASAAP